MKPKIDYDDIMLIIVAVVMSTCLLFCSSAKAEDTIELNKSNVLFLDGEINEVSMDTWLAALWAKRAMLSRDKTLYVLVVSAGGEAQAMAKVVSWLNNMPNVSIICKYAASAAGYIMVTSSHPRLAIKKSIWVEHEMYLNHFTAKNSLDIESLVSFRHESDAFNYDIYTTMHMTKRDYEDKIIGKEWEVKGADLVKLHIADKLVNISCDPYIKRLAPDTCSD